MIRKSLVFGLMLLLALALAGCQEAPEEEAKKEQKTEKAEKKAEQKAEEAAEGKTLRLAMDADPVSLDPHCQLSGGMLQYSHLVFDPLIRWTKDMDFEPRLAKDWERIDDKTMRFYLREGVTFHSGNEFTAEDVVWTVERLKKSADFKGLFDPFEAARVVDSHTVDLVTKKAYPLVLNMATYIFPMDKEFYTGTDKNGEPKDQIKKTGYSFANTHESGTGKYMVVERQQGVKTVFKEYENYWDPDTGNVSKIILTPIKKDSTRVAALLSGDVDFIMPVSPQDYERVDNYEGVKLVTMSGSRIITFQLNQERRPEFKNKKVRQAIVHAVDNPGIVEKIMKGKATPAGQQAPEGFLSYQPELTPRYDLEKAKELMKEAGYPDGFECSMIAPNNRYVKDDKIAQTVAAMLSKINIKVNLTTMPKAQYWTKFDEQSADIQMIGWHPDTEDSANYFEFLLMCRNKETGYGQYNSGSYCNPDLDELILKSQSETDKAKRKELLQEAARIVYEDAAYVPLHWQHLSWAGKDNLEIKPIVNKQNFPYFGDLVIK